MVSDHSEPYIPTLIHLCFMLQFIRFYFLHVATTSLEKSNHAASGLWKIVTLKSKCKVVNHMCI